MTTRRGFLGAILAAGVGPAIVRAESLMVLPRREIALPWATSWEPLLPEGWVWRTSHYGGAVRWTNEGVLFNPEWGTTAIRIACPPTSLRPA
jgi:hypothetical protein